MPTPSDQGVPSATAWSLAVRLRPGRLAAGYSPDGAEPAASRVAR
jgi:hypothetical protein